MRDIRKIKEDLGQLNLEESSYFTESTYIHPQNKQPTITSLDVAEMVGREHKDVMRDIRKIKEDLDALKIAPISYFTDSTYKDKLNRNNQCSY